MRQAKVSTILAGCLAASAAILALFAARDAHGIENYQGTVTGSRVTHNGVTYNVQATVTAPNWYVATLTYGFTPNPAGSTSVDPDPKRRYFKVPRGTYTVNVMNPHPQGTYAVVAPNSAPAAKGMTWRLISTNSPSGTIRVGCGQDECNPYKGDTACSTALPILCIKKTGAGFPLPVPASVNNTDKYNKWSGGVVATTAPVAPPAKLADAHALCARDFGADWRVAEFHDGWGWYFQTYGGVANPQARFWVDINDQKAGRCWK